MIAMMIARLCVPKTKARPRQFACAVEVSQLFRGMILCFPWVSVGDPEHGGYTSAPVDHGCVKETCS